MGCTDCPSSNNCKETNTCDCPVENYTDCVKNRTEYVDSCIEIEQGEKLSSILSKILDRICNISQAVFNAINLGSGQGVYKGYSASTQEHQFKSISTGSSNVEITSTEEEILIDVEETNTNYVNSVTTGNKIGEYQNEQGQTQDVEETITSLEINGQTLSYTDEQGTQTDIVITPDILQKEIDTNATNAYTATDDDHLKILFTDNNTTAEVTINLPSSLRPNFRTKVYSFCEGSIFFTSPSGVIGLQDTTVGAGGNAGEIEYTITRRVSTGEFHIVAT